MRPIVLVLPLQWLLFCFSLPLQAMTCAEYLHLAGQTESLLLEDREKFFELQETLQAALHETNQTSESIAYHQLSSSVRSLKRSLGRDGRKVVSVDLNYAFAKACEKRPKDLAAVVYTQAMVDAMEPLNIRLGYLRSIEGELQAKRSASSSTQRSGQLCNRRDDIAYVALSRYLPSFKSFKTEGWLTLSPQRCMDIGPHQYTYISWDDRSTRATPPRRYTSTPNGRFCIKKNEDFFVLNSNRKKLCELEGGVMKTFLKHGNESESLD